MASLDNFRLVVFRAVAEQLSFRKAAEELYLTQPAVSLQIKALEEDLGVQLFDRTGSRIALTAAGDVLLDYSRQVSTLLAQPNKLYWLSAETTRGNLPWALPQPSPSMCCHVCSVLSAVSTPVCSSP